MAASLLAGKGRDARGIFFKILVADLTHDERSCSNVAMSGGAGGGGDNGKQSAGGLLA